MRIVYTFRYKLEAELKLIEARKKSVNREKIYPFKTDKVHLNAFIWEENTPFIFAFISDVI